MSARPIGVLVIDDSAANRRALTQILDSSPDVRVLGRATDGEEGLKMVVALKPDVITLDLQMPRLDGFSFLRLLMAKVPTPVVVISSYAHRSDVFKALELGAVDFIAKPSRAEKGQLDEIRHELLEKVRAARQARPAGSEARRAPPSRVVGVGASTGGPPAIARLVEALAGQSLCLLIAQHMPPRFTAAFAERLHRAGALGVSEAKEGEAVQPGHAYIAPGGRHLLLSSDDGQLRLRTPAPSSREKHAPSVDRLFDSLAAALGRRSLGIILTGMGSDGASGARAIRQVGGEVWAESEETAIIYGMPKEAIETGSVSRVLRLPDIGPALVAHIQAHG